MPSPYMMSNSTCLKGRRHLVLDDLDARLVAHHLLRSLISADAADVEAHGGVEFQRIAAGRQSPGLPNMMPIFMRIWLMKITMHFDFGDRSRELAQRACSSGACMPGYACRPSRPRARPLGVERGHRVDHQRRRRRSAPACRRSRAPARPSSGCEISAGPRPDAELSRRRSGRGACSASTKAADAALLSRLRHHRRAASVVLPEDSGP